MASVTTDPGTGDDGQYYDWPKDLLKKLALAHRDHTQIFIEHFAMNFAQGNIFKAIVRQMLGGSHSGYERDMRKIAWYANREADLSQEGVEPVETPDLSTYTVQDRDSIARPGSVYLVDENGMGKCGGCGRMYPKEHMTHCPSCLAHRTYSPL